MDARITLTKPPENPAANSNTNATLADQTINAGEAEGH